jgi:hypothetical protein
MHLIDHKLLLYKCLWRQAIVLLYSQRFVALETEAMEHLLIREIVLGREHEQLLRSQPILRSTT